MNLQTNQKGFTIVELLIVIVVIAILAAISIVAYTGIQNNARSSAAASAAASVRDTAEAYNASNGSYPTSKAQFVSGGTEALAKLPSDITFVSSITAAPSSPKTVVVTPRGDPTEGFIITYWNYSDGATATVTVGDTSGSAETPLAN